MPFGLDRLYFMYPDMHHWLRLAAEALMNELMG